MWTRPWSIGDPWKAVRFLELWVVTRFLWPLQDGEGGLVLGAAKQGLMTFLRFGDLRAGQLM